MTDLKSGVAAKPGESGRETLQREFKTKLPRTMGGMSNLVVQRETEALNLADRNDEQRGAIERLEAANSMKIREIAALRKRIRILIHDRNCLHGTISHLILSEAQLEGRARPDATPMGFSLNVERANFDADREMLEFPQRAGNGLALSRESLDNMVARDDFAPKEMREAARDRIAQRKA